MASQAAGRPSSLDLLPVYGFGNSVNLKEDFSHALRKIASRGGGVHSAAFGLEALP